MYISLDLYKKFCEQVRFFNRRVRRYLKKEKYQFKLFRNGMSEAEKRKYKHRLIVYKIAPTALSGVFLFVLALNANANNKILIVNDSVVGVVSDSTLGSTQVSADASIEIKPLSNAITEMDEVLFSNIVARADEQEDKKLPVLSSENIGTAIESASTEAADLELLAKAVAAQEERENLLTEDTKEIETEPALMINAEATDKSQKAEEPAESVMVTIDNTVGSKPVDLINDLLIEDFDDNKIEAYAVYIDDMYIGAVTDTTPIETALALLKAPYLNDDVIALTFDKKISYDKTIELQENMMTNPEEVVDKLLQTEGVARYYEVVPGDCPSIIADKLGITTDELYKLPVTLNGEVIPDISKDCRVGMQIQYQAERKFIHVLVKKDVEYTDMTDYDTVVIEDNTIPEGVVKVETAGAYGEVKKTCREIWFEDTVMESKVIDSFVVSNPVTEVIRKGTMKTKTSVSTYAKNMRGTYFYPVGNHQGYYSAYMGDGRGHKGVDIAAPYGTPIYAAASGTITKAVSSGWGGGYGKHIVISNDDGNSCKYAHMSYLAEGISEGDYVVAGQLIGYVGSTGDSSGNHLHFEVIASDGAYVNPCDYIE